MAPERIRRAARREIDRLDAGAATERASKAAAGRGVRFGSERDGQASAIVTGPAIPLTRWYTALSEAARAQQIAGDPRGLDALRFDLLVAGFTCAADSPTPRPVPAPAASGAAPSPGSTRVPEALLSPAELAGRAEPLEPTGVTESLEPADLAEPTDRPRSPRTTEHPSMRPPGASWPTGLRPTSSSPTPALKRPLSCTGHTLRPSGCSTPRTRLRRRRSTGSGPLAPRSTGSPPRRCATASPPASSPSRTDGRCDPCSCSCTSRSPPCSGSRTSPGGSRATAGSVRRSAASSCRPPSCARSARQQRSGGGPGAPRRTPAADPRGRPAVPAGDGDTALRHHGSLLADLRAARSSCLAVRAGPHAGPLLRRSARDAGVGCSQRPRPRAGVARGSERRVEPRGPGAPDAPLQARRLDPDPHRRDHPVDHTRRAARRGTAPPTAGGAGRRRRRLPDPGALHELEGELLRPRSGE